MNNPWESVPLITYETHMGLSHIGQQQALSDIIKQQISNYPEKTVTILGIAGGNGLEHIAKGTKVYGIDVNGAYLEACARRFEHLGDSLTLIQADLSDDAACLPATGLIIANLFIEYIGISVFVRLVKTCSPHFVSCVIQDSSAQGFVSSSPYAQAFLDIAAIHEDIDAQHLAAVMQDVGYELIKKTQTILPDQKRFFRFDLKQREISHEILRCGRIF